VSCWTIYCSQTRVNAMLEMTSLGWKAPWCERRNHEGILGEIARCVGRTDHQFLSLCSPLQPQSRLSSWQSAILWNRSAITSHDAATGKKMQKKCTAQRHGLLHERAVCPCSARERGVAQQSERAR